MSKLDGFHLAIMVAYSTDSALFADMLDLCIDPECMTCGKIVCPHDEPLHFHHDGCPACIASDNVTI